MASCVPGAVLSSGQVCAGVPLHVEPLLALKMQSLLAETPQVLQPATPARPAPRALHPASHLMAAAVPNEPCSRESSKAAAADMPHINRACSASMMGRAHPDVARPPTTVAGLGSAAIAGPGGPESLHTGLSGACDSLSAKGQHEDTDVLHNVHSPAMAGSSRVPNQAPACQRQTLRQQPAACTSSQGVQALLRQSSSADQPVLQAVHAQAHSTPKAAEQQGQLSELAPVHDTAATPHLEAASASLASGYTASPKSHHGGASASRHASGAQKPADNDSSAHGQSTPGSWLEGKSQRRPIAEAQQTNGSAGVLSKAREGSKQASKAQQSSAPPAQAEQGEPKEGRALTARPSETHARAGASDIHTALQTVQV